MSSLQPCRKIPKPSCPSGSRSPEPSQAAANGRLSSDFVQESQNRPLRGRRARQHQNTETEGHTDLLQKLEDPLREEQTDHVTRQQSEISQTQRTRPHNTHQGKPQLDSSTSVRGRPGPNRPLRSSPKTQKQGRLSFTPQALKQSQSKLNKCLSSGPKRAAQGRPQNNAKTSRSGPNKVLSCSRKTPQQGRLGSGPKTPKCTQSGPKRVQSSSRKNPKQGQSQHKPQVSSVPKTLKRGRPQVSPKTSKPGPNKPLSSSPKTSKQGHLGSNKKTPKCTQSEPKKRQRSSPKTAKQTCSQQKSKVGSIPKTLSRGRPRHNPQPGPKPSKHRPKKPLSSSPKIPNQGRLDSSPKTPKCTQSGPTEDLSSSPKQDLSQHKSQVSSVPQTLKCGRGRPRHDPQPGPKPSKHRPKKPLSSSPKIPNQGRLDSSPKTPKCTQSGPTEDLSSSPKQDLSQHKSQVSSVPQTLKRGRGQPRLNPQLSPETSSSGPNNTLTCSPKTPPLRSSPTLLKQGQLPSSPETPNHPQSGSNSPLSSSPKTPERGRARHNPPLSSTPRYNHAELKEPEISPVKKTQPKKRFRSQEAGAQQRKRRKTEQETREALPIQQRRRESGAAAELSLKQPVTSVRRRFEIHESEQDPVDELSSDLSIELSVQENKHTLSLDEEDEEDEELPSFLQRQKPSIREGLCVWCKLRKYPFWPAVVKSVNRKSKKASIVFIDQFLFDKKRICKGLSVSLRTLKPFDCEESDSFVDKAKERYGKCIMLCVKLISDYRISVGCGFVGSIIEYIADDLSYPLRSEYTKASSSLLSPTQSLIEQQGGDFELQECDAVSSDLEDLHVTKKVLPDRSQAARNRANQRLVDFIVRGGAEARLLSVIGGQEASKWLQALQSPTRHLVEVYLEDEEQVESVYRYLEQLYKSVPKSSLLLENTEQIPFILDVLFPEALICALARVEGLSMEKAEEKFRQGPRHSNRERQEFDRMIEQQMNLKAVH